LVRVVGLTALLGLSVGLGACGDPPYYSSEAFFANTTREGVNVRLLELAAAVDCKSVSGHACERLNESAFVFERMYAVAPGQALPLEYDENFWGNQAEWSENACGAAVVQIIGLPSTCVFWKEEGGAGSEQLASVRDPEFRRRSIRLEGTKGLYRLAVGSGLEAGELLRSATSDPRSLLGFSGRAAAPSAIVDAVTELPDGCLAIEHRALAPSENAPRSTLYLCVPRWAFPFVVPSEITISTVTGLHGAEILTIQEPGGSRRLELVMNGERQNLVPLEGAHATRCGAYVENLGLETATGIIAPGEMSETTSDGVRTRVLLGRAEHVVVAPATCEPARAAIGRRLDLLTVNSLETDP
jgi:hypothetical protein